MQVVLVSLDRGLEDGVGVHALEGQGHSDHNVEERPQSFAVLVSAVLLMEGEGSVKGWYCDKSSDVLGQDGATEQV